MHRLKTFTIIFLLSSAMMISAEEIYVPRDQRTIQDGINAASDGDMVIVADGTYTGIGNRAIDFSGKAVTLRSEMGPENCVIDCEDYDRGFRFHTGEGADSIIRGFTITNGRFTGGSGICCEYSSPTIMENIIVDNVADSEYGAGAGIACYHSDAIIKSNMIMNNSCPYLESSGGGISCFYGSPVIENNIISHNDCFQTGGGIFYASLGFAVIRDNVITANDAFGFYGKGGGIWCSGLALIMNNKISGNTAEIEGGGIACTSDLVDIINNVIDGNISNGNGGGLYFYDASPMMINNTITANTAVELGGGICLYRDSMATVINTILWDNLAATGTEVYIGTPDRASTLTISYSCVGGGLSSVHVETNCTLNWDAGMIDANPLFVEGRLGDFYLSQVAAGQSGEELSAIQIYDSPCVDAGYPGLRIAGNVGTTRTDHVLDAGIIDMGCHYPLLRIQIHAPHYFLEEVTYFTKIF